MSEDVKGAELYETKKTSARIADLKRVESGGQEPAQNAHKHLINKRDTGGGDGSRTIQRVDST